MAARRGQGLAATVVDARRYIPRPAATVGDARAALKALYAACDNKGRRRHKWPPGIGARGYDVGGCSHAADVEDGLDTLWHLLKEGGVFDDNLVVILVFELVDSRCEKWHLCGSGTSQRVQTHSGTDTQQCHNLPFCERSGKSDLFACGHTLLRYAQSKS